jgi:putative ABC transport system permease protein
VDGGYFDALGIALARGRLFDRRDTVETPPVALVNQALVRTYFPDEDPLGLRINVGGDLRAIVGIVGDVRQDLRNSAVPKVYLPHDQFGGDRNWSMVQLVRAADGRADIAAVARRELAAIDPDLIVHDVRPFDDVVAANIAGPRFAMTLMGAFAGLALLLAAVGLYGVVAFAVAGRTREIGIRMALGARAPDVLRLVLRQGLGLATAGVALGLMAATAGARVMTSLLYQVEATDLTTFAAALALVAVVALGATLVPARRAVAVEPTEALRAE